MKNLTVLVYLCFITFLSIGQKNVETFGNLDFENIENDTAKDWKNFGKGAYSIEIDTVISQKGKNSAVIEFTEGKANFNAWAYSIPAIYEGKTIKLTGFIKTENVSDGHAGLWMRIDPQVSFDNMRTRGITGTTDWQKYEIELALKPEQATKIVVGGLLVGKGKMWIDNLQITIDGKPLNKAKLKKLSKAQQDTEFNEGSKIDSIILTEQKIEDLKTLGQLWGFMKYYHPNVSTGDYNWDFELFRIMPQILNSNSTTQRDEYLNKWVTSYGKYKYSKKEKKSKKEVKMKADLDWISNPELSKALSQELKNIKLAKRSNSNYYIKMAMFIGNPVFRNEDKYSSMRYPDAGFRLLSLYRYWNTIQYYFPYKYLIEEDWNNVLTEFIPKFVNAKNETEYKLAVLEIITRVNDSHANIWSYDQALNKYWGINYPALKVNFVENKAIVTGYYNTELGQETSLKIGDEIVKINDKLVSDMVKDRLKYTPASNYPTKLRNIARTLLKTNDSVLNIEYISNAKTDTKSIEALSYKKMFRNSSPKKKDTCFKFINKDIAYLYLGTIKSDYLPEIFDTIKNTKGLIIDLRCYPSDFVAHKLSNYLMPEKTDFTKFTKGSNLKPGNFYYTKNSSVGKNNKDYYKGKVVILINETTQSQAEFTTMAFRVAPKATVIGSTTSAADGNVSEFYLPGGIKTMITGIGVYYPDNTETQRVGIISDVEIKPTIEGIKNHRDELMEKAIEVINK